MAIKCEITPFEFWDYTIAEVNDLIEAHTEKQKYEMQFKAACSYHNAMMVINGVNNLFSKNPKQPLQIWEVFDGLFDKPKQIVNQTKEEIMKARLLAYNEAWKNNIERGDSI